MRKNKFFMLGIITVFVAILSLTFVSSTFARYTSTVDGDDTARVAKWSFTYTQNAQNDKIGAGQDDENYKVIFDLFNTIKDSDGADDDADVENDNDTAIIAPGTSGSFTFSLKNDSEVTAEYHIHFTETNNNDIPLQYSLDGTNWFNSLADLEAAPAYKEPNRGEKPRLDDATGAAELHATLPMTEDDTLTVYWRWQYQSDGAGHPGHSDETDTSLGIGPTAQVTIEVEIRFDQVD